MSARGMQARWDRKLREVGRLAAPCWYCEKVQYTSRSAARKAARRHPDKMSTYECPHGTGMWHIGHMSARIRYGYETRLERYGGAA